MGPLFRRIVLLFFVGLTAPANGQPNLLARTYGPAEGFTTSQVNAITQDAQGFMWFGTSTGLYRFDGYSFLPFVQKEKDSLSLSDNFIRCLYADSSGFLWIGTLRRGVCRLDLKKMTIKRFHDAGDSIGRNSIIHAIEGDQEGNIWVAGQRGLHKYSSGRWQRLKFKDVPNKTVPFGLHATRNGKLWMGYPNCGVASYTPESGEFRYYNLSPETRKSPVLIRSLVEDSSGTVWLAAQNDGIIRFNPQNNQAGYIPAPLGKPIWSVTQTSDGRLLASGADALYTVDKKAMKLQKVDNSLTGIATDGTQCSFESVDGIIWIGTGRNGVISAHQVPSMTMTPIPFGATLGNIIKIGNTHYSLFSGQGLQVRNPFTGMDSLRQVSGMPSPDYDIYDAAIYPKGTLWLATTGGIFRRTPAGKWKRFERPSNPNHSLAPAKALLFDEEKNQLWAGGSGTGCYKYDSASDSFVFLEGSGGQITDLASTPQGIWTAKPDNGLRLMPIGSAETQEFLYKGEDSTSISNSYVSRLLIDRAGTLWAGTLNGLNRFNASTSTFTRIKISDKSNSIYNMDYAYDSSFLVQTKDGVYRFDPLSNNLVAQKIQTPVDLTNPYGVLHYPWFTYEKDGFLVEYHLDSITPVRIPPKIAITSFTLDPNNTHPLRAEEANLNPAYRDHIELDYDQNLINLSFAALDFSSPGKNQYAYRLEGFDAGWTFSGTRNFVTYTNLDPGNYTFSVRGANGYGVWSDQPASLSITILPPPWKTWWAYTGYGLMFIGLLLAARKITVNRERLKAQVAIEQKEKQTLRELDHLKTKFFSNITHEFRTPLTLIQGPADELLGKTEDKEARKLLGLIKSNANRLLRLINQLLDLAKLDAREMKLHLAPVNLASLVRITMAQFTSMAESKSVRYDWQMGEKLPTVAADEEKLETIISNLISNAMKFTPVGGTVDIQANWDGKDFILVISDTGRGIPAEKLPHIFDRFYQVSPTDASHAEGTGIGLALVKEYMEIMKGVLEVESKVGSGTTFTVKLPFTTVGVEAYVIESVRGQSDEPPALAIVSEKNGQLPLLLLVEDNAELRSFIRNCLGNEYRFSEASQGREGMTLAVNQVPDLIISDLMMPEMDGLELCARLKKDKRTDHIPFIMLTAKAAEENKLEGLQTGANEYLVKPFNKAELLLKVQNLITLRANLQTHIRTTILAQASDVQAVSAEEQFVLKARLFVEANLKDEMLSVESLAQEMNLSREQCYRKINALTGLAPSAFIRKIKLQRAHQLLTGEWGPVSQVAYETGFENLSYFSKAFKEEFGKLPSEV